MQGKNQSEMVFSNFQVKRNVIKGSGKDTVGVFAITGSVLPTGQCHFVKQYVGMHAVEYDGSYTKTRIAGRWSLPAYGMSDTFEIKVNLVILNDFIRKTTRRAQAATQTDRGNAYRC